MTSNATTLRLSSLHGSLLVCALLFSGALLHGSKNAQPAASEDPTACETDRMPDWAWESLPLTRQGDEEIFSSAQLAGALVRTATGFFQIIECDLALNSDGYLYFSKITFLTDQNEIMTSASGGEPIEVIDQLCDLGGFIIGIGNAGKYEAWVDRFRIVIDQDGYLNIRFQYAYDPDTGERRHVRGVATDGITYPGGLAPPPHCDWDMVSACIPSPNCTVCPNVAPCDCTAGEGCTTGFATLCLNQGTCATSCDTEFHVPPVGIPFWTCFCKG